MVYSLKFPVLTSSCHSCPTGRRGPAVLTKARAAKLRSVLRQVLQASGTRADQPQRKRLCSCLQGDMAQVQQPRTVCWGQARGVTEHISLPSLPLSPLCVDSSTPTSFLVRSHQAGCQQDRVPRTCTLSTGRGCTTSNCSAPSLWKARTRGTCLFTPGLFHAGEHTDPCDRASSSALAGAQAGRNPKEEPMDTPHPCSREAASGNHWAGSSSKHSFQQPLWSPASRTFQCRSDRGLQSSRGHPPWLQDCHPHPAPNNDSQRPWPHAAQSATARPPPKTVGPSPGQEWALIYWGTIRNVPGNFACF